MFKGNVKDTLVISPQSLSAEYRRLLSQSANEIYSFVTLSTLRRKGIVGLVKYLRSFTCRQVLIALETKSDAVMMPVLQALSIVVPTSSRSIVDSHGLRSPYGIGASLSGAVGTLKASLRIARQHRQLVKQLAMFDVTPVETAAAQRGDTCLYVNANLWFGLKAGGSVGHVAGVANAFCNARIPVHYIAAVDSVGLDAKIQQSRFRLPRHFGLPWERNLYAINTLAIRDLRKIVEGNRPRFIYQRMSLGSTAGVQISQEEKLPLVLEYNGSETWIAKNWGTPLRYQQLAERIEELNLCAASLIVTVSKELERDLTRRGVAEDRIVMYPNGVDTQLFCPRPKSDPQVEEVLVKYGIPKRSLVVGFVGTFGAWHGAEVLARAVRKLLDEHPDWVEAHHFHFLLVGDGVRMPDVLTELGPWSESPQVILTGLIPQLETPFVLNGCDILVSPHIPNSDGSKFFGSPTKLFEYMASGKAVIGSDLDQIGEVLREVPLEWSQEHTELSGSDHTSGVIVEPGNVEEIVEAIQSLADDEGVRRAYGERARQVVLERHTWEQHVMHILQALESREEL